MSTKTPTIEDLEARLDVGGTVTSTEWAKAEANDQLASAKAAAEDAIAERKAEADRKAATKASLDRIDGRWAAAQAVIGALDQAADAYAKLHDAADELIGEWTDECRTLRDLGPGQHVLHQEGAQFTVATPGGTLYGIHRHLAAQLIAEVVDEHYAAGEKPGELRSLFGSAPEHRHQLLATLASGAPIPEPVQAPPAD